jgi:hypothetical protein
MTPAESARENAISFECKKDALQQRQSGDWKISFTVQGIDMDSRLSKANPGTRYVAVLVEINDQELPVTPVEKENSKSPSDVSPATPRRLDKPAGAKRDWRALPKPQQAGIRLNEPTFAAYLREEHSHDWRETGEVDACLKFMCGIQSKRELATDPRAGALWFQIDSGYQAWLAKERVGA